MNALLERIRLYWKLFRLIGPVLIAISREDAGEMDALFDKADSIHIQLGHSDRR
jgi:hypothetical protein